MSQFARTSMWQCANVEPSPPKFLCVHMHVSVVFTGTSKQLTLIILTLLMLTMLS